MGCPQQEKEIDVRVVFIEIMNKIDITNTIKWKLWLRFFTVMNSNKLGGDLVEVRLSM